MPPRTRRKEEDEDSEEEELVSLPDESGDVSVLPDAAFRGLFAGLKETGARRAQGSTPDDELLTSANLC